MTDFNSWSVQTWALLAVLGSLVFMLGIALWRWRTVAMVLTLLGAALVAVTLWKGDPIWTSVAAVGTLLLGWGLAVIRRRPRAAPWLALVGILAALTGIGTGNLWTGGKTVVEMVSNSPNRVGSTTPTETPSTSTAEPTPPATPEPSAITPPTEPPAQPDSTTPPIEPAPAPAEPAPPPDTTNQPPADSTGTPETPPAEPAPPALAQPDTTALQPPTEPISPSESAAVSNAIRCPCTLDVSANVNGANVTLLRDGQVEATGQVPATFVNLPAGAYTLRVEVAGYKPFEGEIPLSESRNIVVRLEQ